MKNQRANNARTILILAALAASSCFAQEREQAGVALDLATTAIGVGTGVAVEANPLALPLLPVRLHAIERANKLPDGERQTALDQINAVNTGVVVSNLVVLGFHAFVPVVGVIAGAVVYQRGEKKREFMVACQQHKEVFPETAKLPCVF